MDVVRFKEDDVIVASGFDRQFAILSGWQNKKSGDAKLVFSNGGETTYSWQDLQTAGHYHMLGNLAFFMEDSSITIDKLAENEEAYGEWNGTYETFDGGYTYRKQ